MEFIQYYVPPAKGLKDKLKKAPGFRVYHLVGWDHSKKTIPSDVSYHGAPLSEGVA